MSVLFIVIVLSTIDSSWTQNASHFSDRDFSALEHNAFGYLENIGIPEAKRVYMEEDSQYLMPRIVGGEAADIKQYKYQAGLIISIANLSGFGLCGGSLISATRVATAAHCWSDGLHNATSMVVVLGSSKIFSGGTRINTTQVYVHPAWNPMLASDDVAVVYLPHPVTFSKTIAPIALPFKSNIYDCLVGKTAMASGFGRTGEGIPVPADQVLSKVNVTVISNEECSQTYPNVIRYTNICTSGNSASGHVGICNGDSGGPLALTKNNNYILIGIASFGSPRGCNMTLPNGWTRVSSYLDFLQKHM